jgi:mannosyltransferase OCH1-like enzyme
MTSIPKIIHQIWLQGVSYISDKSRERINKIKNIHDITDNISIEGKKVRVFGEWEYKLWDEIQILNLLQSLDKKYIEKYYKFTYLHQKVDYAKFIILKVYGGIYIDIDCNVIKNLDGLFEYVKDYDFIISYISQTNKLFNYVGCGYLSKCINNGIIISKKDTDICNYIIDELKYDCDDLITRKSKCITNTTGPVIFNKIIYSYLSNNNSNKSKVLILPPEYLEPCLFDVCNNTKNTYIEHIHEWTWIGDNYKKICLFYTRNTALLNVIFAITVIILVLYFF